MLQVECLCDYDTTEPGSIRKAVAKVNKYIEKEGIKREDILECHTRIEKYAISYGCTIILTYWKNGEGSIKL